MNLAFFRRATRSMMATALVAATAVAAPTTADAQSFFHGGNGTALTEFGASGITTVGESFVALGSTLSSFSFFLINEAALGVAGDTGADRITFTAYIAAWDGTTITGPVLFASSTQTGPTTGNARYDFITGGLAVTTGASYIAYLRINDDSPSDASAALELSDVPFATGSAFASTASDLTASDSWLLLDDTHLALAANFSPVQVPEPTTAVLTLVGLAGIAVRARRRTS